MKINQFKSHLLIFQQIFLMFSCADSISNQGLIESKVQSADSTPILIDKNKNDEEIPIFAGIYSITMTVRNGDSTICSGDFDGVLWSNQRFIPKGIANCILNKKIDLAEAFPDDTTKGMKEFPGYGSVVRKVNRKDYTLTPNPISGLGIVQNHEYYRNFTKTEDIKLVYQDVRSIHESNGKIIFNVTGLNQSMQISSGDAFDKVISYKTQSEGFQNAPKKEAGIEISRETWVNTRPLALLKIEIVSTLEDHLPGIAGQIGDVLLGPLLITIQLKSPREILESDYIN